MLYNVASNVTANILKVLKCPNYTVHAWTNHFKISL